ncbi:hypothetical protein B0F90DRAFT_1274747 [Multifurca ochricompacta]|uniref:Uncharacterized protein n=1 Tax=Multifurca ochricompacta TaxID=376703 RepID=A0AAD4LY33_9AGAM|nr:hypothetical protein B0F90DRAFT_1274747 [Multifurca ochricompacta]
MAKLGSTRGRWHGVCSGSNAPHSLYKSSKRNNQGAIDADPYPRPPVPVLDLRETRERVENWQANVLSAPLSQVDSGDPEQKNQSVPVEDDRRSPPLKFPTVKRRKDNVVKVMKHPNLPENLKCDAQGAIRVASPPRGSNVELTPRSRKVALGMVPKIARTPSPPTPNTASIPENIHQVSEVRGGFPAGVRTFSVDNSLLGIFSTLVSVTTTNVHAAAATSTCKAPCDSTGRRPVSRFPALTPTVSSFANC